MMIRGNRISNCGNAGIRIWRDEAGPRRLDHHRQPIAKIDWKGGGNGQNGNGVNVFQADEVIVSDNVISDCAFTAVRVNAGKNTQVRGNTCLNSGEVAIFSEFGFSGSVIADNIIDGAATGIYITNLDSGGHLATCTGNIVRNIYADVGGEPRHAPRRHLCRGRHGGRQQRIESVPGIGIVAGYGPFVRNVVISDNVLDRRRYRHRRQRGAGQVTGSRCGSAAISIGAGARARHRRPGMGEVVSDDLAARRGELSERHGRRQHDQLEPAAVIAAVARRVPTSSPRTLRMVCVAKRSARRAAPRRDR